MNSFPVLLSHVPLQVVLSGGLEVAVLTLAFGRGNPLLLGVVGMRGPEVTVKVLVLGKPRVTLCLALAGCGNGARDGLLMVAPVLAA